MTKIDDELSQLREEILRSVTEDIEDEVDTTLVWLSPTFQPQIPTLRIKQCLKVVMQHSNDTMKYLMQQYYITLIRAHFFTHFNELANWKDMIKLEKLYVSKIEYMMGTESTWIHDEVACLKHVLMKQNTGFRKNIHAKLESFVLSNDLDRFEQMYVWLTPAFNGMEVEFDVRLINMKIVQLSELFMRKKVDNRYLVMNTYNTFIREFWSKFSKLLIPQDDHELTAIIYQTFENNFIAYKSEEFYTDIVPQFPKSRKCLLEFRSILSKDIKIVGMTVLETLYHGFVSRFLTSSLLSCEILLNYVKTVKCLKIIDPMGICLRSLSKAVRKHLNSRPDVIQTLILGLFPFQNDERLKIASLTDGSNVHLDKLEELSHEIGDFSLGPDVPTALPWLNQPHVPRCTYDGNDPLLKQYLNWVPDPPKIKLAVEHNDSNESDGSEIKYTPPTDLMDVLLETLESKKALVDGVLGVLSGKFIESEDYSLDPEWQKIMDKLLAHLEETRQGTVTAEENDITHLSDVDIMLKDLKLSSKFRNTVSQMNNVRFENFPHIKILSKLYWRHYQELNGKLITTRYKWDAEMEALVTSLTKTYEKLNIGRTLRFDSGTSSRVSIDLIMKTGEKKSFRVTMEQYLLISQFQNESSGNTALQRPKQYSLKALFQRTRMSKSKLLDVLSFWQEQGVITKHIDGTYSVNE